MVPLVKLSSSVSRMPAEDTSWTMPNIASSLLLPNSRQCARTLQRCRAALRRSREVVSETVLVSCSRFQCDMRFLCPGWNYRESHKLRFKRRDRQMSRLRQRVEGSPESEVRSQRSEVRSQRSEV